MPNKQKELSGIYLKGLNKLYQFNWYELKSISSNIPEGIIVLTHALVTGYNSVISLDDGKLIQKLKIDYVPPVIYRSSVVIRTKDGLVNRYKTEEPQAYFYNRDWLYDNTNVSAKVIYLYALSQRSITNKNLFISEKYLEEKFWDNPYLQNKNGKLWFKPELNRITNILKLKET